MVRDYPGGKPVFAERAEIALVFSEPIDTARLTDQTFLLWTDENLPVAMEQLWRDPFHLEFAPAELEAGESYRLVVTEFDIVDRAGNLMGDSAAEYRFRLLDDDSLGSVTGRVEIRLPGRAADPAVLSFVKTENNQLFELPVAGQQFEIDLPAGAYLLTGFVDSNGNGQRDLGSLFPFAYAETLARYPDTVNVRARFETAGVDFRID
jgi:hypothetical protein